METALHDRRDGDDDGREASPGGLAAARTPSASPDTAQYLFATTSADSEARSRARLQADGRNGNLTGSGDPRELTALEWRRKTAGGSRLVRWAAALAGGRVTDRPPSSPPRTAPGSFPGKKLQQHRRSVSNGVDASTDKTANHGGGGGGGKTSGGGGTGGGDPASASAAPGAVFSAEGSGLFTPSPLRNRFRPMARRGSNGGWSSSSASSAAVWAVGGAGAGGERGAGSSGLPASLGKVFKGPLSMYVIRQLKMAAALVALAVAGMGALMVAFCLYLTVRPWGRATYRRLLCSQLAAPLVDSASLLLPRTRVRVTGDSDMLDGLCPGMIVSNTLPGNAFLGLDWWAILMVARAVGAHGYTKVLVSERLNHTPVLGWILRILEFPGLGDCYQGDRDRVKQSLASFAKDSVTAGPSGVPYLFLHFPEGDTLNRDTLASSLEFAKREERPELLHLLLPHTTRLSACLDGLRPAKPVVYDVTLAGSGYSGEVPCARRPPTCWDVLHALIAGRAWRGGRRNDARPCLKPSCGCRPKEKSDGAGDGSSVGAVGDGAGAGGGSSGGDFCGEASCLCRTGGAGTAAAAALVGGASGTLGFANASVGSVVGGIGSGGGSGSGVSPRGIGARSQSVGGIARSESGDWGADVGGGGGRFAEGGGGGVREAERGWGRGCQDIHVRIKRYSLEEVLGNTHWLDDRWAEKERLLAYFSRHQSFPSDGRGFPARRTLDTRGAQFEGSAMSFVRLSAVLLVVPLVSLAAIPAVVAMAMAALTYRLVCASVRGVATRVLPRRLTRRIWCPGYDDEGDEEEDDELGQDYHGRQSTLTPWWGGPATPLNTPAPGRGAGPVPFMTKSSVPTTAVR